MSENEKATTPPAEVRIGRRGCIIGVIIWLVVMTIPAFILLLAIQQEVTIWHGSGFPEREAHPLLQVRLIMEIESRGVSIGTSHISRETETLACVQTNVNYLLWQGQGESASYCDCYQREDPSADWQFNETYTGICQQEE